MSQLYCQQAILHRDSEGVPFIEHWDYRPVIGKLKLLERSTRPDIAYAVHQCARFAPYPHASHAATVRQIVRNLIGSKMQGLTLNPRVMRGKHEFLVWAYADFCGGWNKETSATEVIMTAKSGL